MKGGKPKIGSRLTVSAGGLIFALTLPAPAVRSASAILPSGASVAAGSASVLAPGANSTLVVQSSRKAIINWQSFSVGSGATVTFQQPDSGAITLNRVTGAGASAIDGNLFANGQVWLINGNGILFGQGSRINIGGLIATTSDIRDSDFLSGNYNFGIASGNKNAAIVNKGAIKTSPGGSAVLSAARVANEGVIEANLGHVVLGGAETFAVDFDGDNLIRYAITAPVSDSPKDADGKAAPDLVSNSGTIAAQGGKVLLTARAARNVVDNVINTTGIIEATTATAQNGVIVFDAGDSGTVNISGTVDVSGKRAGENGGTITLSADRANIADGARLDASGDSAGGAILIGANPSSGPSEQNVHTVTVGQAELTANAGRAGNGGTVTVYASGETTFAGAIEAKGGVNGGNGGTVETSGGNLTIAQTARVDTSAPSGLGGTWLLDPQNLDIDANQAATIVSNVATTSVVLEATGDINVASAIKYNSPNSLSLLAKQNVNVTASVQNAGTGSLLALAGWDGVTPPVSAAAIQSAYGNNGGSILIGGANAAAGVALGSMGGTTVIAASGLALTASNGYAQVGYHGDAQGGIILGLRGQLTLTGGGDSGFFAQIGHGGYLVAGGNNGPISSMVAGNITITAGSAAAAYAQIGNGGYGVSGDQLGNIAISAGGSLTLSGNGNSYARIGNGGAASSGNDSGDIAANISGGVTLNNAQIGNAGTTIAGKVIVTSGSNLSVGAGSAVSANASGDALILAAQGQFNNQAGGGALSAGSGRWLVFLDAPASNVAGGLSALPFYNRAYNFQTGAYTPVTSAGNRFVYALAPTLTVTADGKTKVYGTANPPLTATITGLVGGDSLASAVSGAPSLSTAAVAKSNIGNYTIVAGLGTLASDLNYGFQFANGTLHIDPATLTASLTGKVEKTYDGTTAATLTGSNYQLSGIVAGDNVALNNPASGSYDTKNVGINKTVTVSGVALTGADSGNYTLASGTIAGNVGIIDAAQLVASLTGKVEKTYDGTTAATLAPANYHLSGTVFGNDNVALNNPASGSYDTKNVGINKTVTVGGVALTGADAGNYALASGTIAGNVGIIDAAQLVASLTGKVEKTYDGTTAATLAPANYHLSGTVFGNDNVSLNSPANGSYDTKNVGINKTVTVSGVALTGADSGNYTLASSTIAGNVGIIDAAQLVASLTGKVEKTYDGTTAATLAPANYHLSGTVFGNDNVALNNPASGSYDTKNVGINKTVTVSGVALTGADSGNYTLASGTIAGNVGIIDAAQLVASLTGKVEKTYDGTTAATLTAANYQLSGVVGNDAVALNNPANGSYDTKNAGINKTVTVSGVALTGADSGNYTLASGTIAGNVGIIDAAQLVASLTGKVEKTYDGTTAATLTAANYQLSGIIGNDAVALNNPANGSYDTKNVGINKTVTVGGVALTGADSGNYTLASGTVAGNVGIIDAAQLVASLTGKVEKTYDGTTAATLTGSNYQLSGVIGSDNVALNNPASGSYDTKNVGINKTVTVSGVALIGADSGNYALASGTISANIGIIDAAQLIASLTGKVEKTYDRTTAATLTGSNYQLSGVIGNDNVALNNPASGSYDTKNVGINKTVTVSGVALTGADSGNYTLASGSIAGNVGIIDAAQLVASLTGKVEKTYDGTTAATLTAANYQLSGVIGNDNVALNNPASGSYDTKNVGINKTVTVSGVALTGADSGNYTLASGTIAGNVGIIDAAQLIASLTGKVEKTYDGTTAATLTGSNYQLSGVIGNDAVALNNPANGSYDTKNVGIGKTVTVSGVALTGADAGNYALAPGTIAGNVGIIDAAQLVASLTGKVEKTYDGTTGATLTAANYQLSGVIGNDNVALNNPASGSYDTKNVGINKTVTVGGVALTGVDAGNYALASGTISANIGIIDAAQLIASLTGKVEKTYDGTTAATLTAANYQLSGVIGNDAVGLNNPASGSYDTKNVGIGKTVSVSGVALTGADSGNYTLASGTIAGNVGIIDAAQLIASLTGKVEKTYDGTTAATLTGSNYQLSGVIGNDNVALNNPASGSYDTKNVGINKTVTVSGVALTGADSGNYTLASGNISGNIGIIDAAQLVASLTGKVEKTYDGTTAATLTGSNYQLSGVIGNDNVGLNNPANGSYDTKNAGINKTVTVSGVALTGTDAGNYVLASGTIAGNVGFIDAAPLVGSLSGTVAKTYDGTTAATLTGSNYQLSGVVGNDNVALNNPASGIYDSKNVGIGKTVSVSGVALTGGDSGNYTLVSSSISANIGTISAATVTASLTGTVEKVFDSTTTATLTPANYQLSGAVNGDSVGLNNPTSGVYDTSSAGIGKVVTVSGLALAGTDSANYALASDSISAAIGVITNATTNVVIDNGVIADLIGRPFIPTQPPPLPFFPPVVNNPSDATSATGAADDDFAQSNMLADTLGNSLSGESGSVRSSTIILIEGLLKQFEPPPGGLTPHAIPPFGQTYSSWGNEAFWQ